MITAEEVRQRLYDSLASSPDGILVSDVWIDKEVKKNMSEANTAVKKYSRTETDWEKELRDEDIITNESGKKIVLLRGLQRLARLAGIIESYPSTLDHVIGPDGLGMIQCVYWTRWPDGAVFGASADVNRSNVNADFMKFPTTVAESRAEGRAIRKALGITMLTAEELDTTEGFTGVTKAESGKADSAQIAAIERLVEDTGTEAIDVIGAVVNDGREVLDLADLTPAEAIDAMRFLNDQRGNKSKRDARKAALKKEVGGE